MTVTSTNQKVSFSGNGSTTVFAYNFKIFAQTDLLVILRSATGTETTQQLTSNYTVSGVGATSGGNVTMGVAPPSGTTLVIQRVQPQLQGLDLVPNDPFPAGSMEDALDKLVFNVQTLNEEVGRAIKASTTNTIGNTEFTISATDRANKLFSFDSSGNLNIAQELGTYKGNWGASTAYAVRDLVKDTSTGNIFICVTAHTSSGSQPLTTNTDAAKWALIVDAASATTSQNAAAASATASANSATASASSASTASTKADEAAASASTASTKAGEAASSATASASSATSAASTLTTFQQQYHGAASSNPTSNLTEGDLYFKTGSGGGMRVYNGSAWVNAAFDVSGALINTNNLSDVSSAATALTNLGVNSTAAELNKLDALSRGSLIYGNASAATAILTKGGAGTVLSSDGTDLSWVAASGGGEATFTATGAISAGNPVGFNANGTVSAMQKLVGSGVSLGSGAGSGVVGRQPMAYDTANNKYLHVFQGTNTKLFARVGTVSSNFGLSFGTAVDSGITLSNFVAQRGCLHLVYDDNAGKFVVSYAKSDNKGYASTITISGTTPSFGTEINVFNGTTYHTEVGYDSNANKVLFVNAGNQDHITGRVGTISGTSISLGSQVNLGNHPVHPQPGSLSFNTTANKFIFMYAVGSNGSPLSALTMTISGTSVSAGSVISITSSLPSNRTANSVYDPSINKTVAVYVVGTTPVFKLLTISGTSISAGTETTIPFATTPAHQAYTQNHVQAVVDPDNNGLIFAYSTANSSNQPGGTCVTPGTFSGSTLTLGVEVRVSDTAGLAGLIYDPDTNQTVIGTSALGVADSAEDQVVNAAAGARPAYVGIAAENISNGATGKVTIIGGVNANQSSLSAGSQYGIPTSSASLVATDTNPVGIAISSTEIYLRAVSL